MYTRYEKAVSDLEAVQAQLLISSNEDLKIQHTVNETHAAIIKSNEKKKDLVNRLNNIVSRWKPEDERALL